MIDSRILLADDDRELRASVAELLSDLGAEFVEVESGDEALIVLRRRQVDLALLDMHMPGLTGLEVLATLRRETLDVPCIFLPGEASEAVCNQALREGARAVLKKPFEPAALRREVALALETPR